MPSSFFEELLETMDSQGWKYAVVEGHEVVELSFEAHHTRVPMHVQCFAQQGLLSVVARLGQKLSGEDEALKLRQLELLMRVNETLTVGNFEARWEGKEMLFRVSNLFSDGVELKILSGLIHTAVVEVDRVTPLLALLKNGKKDVPALLKRVDTLPGEEGE